jgi:hypothetical protein
LVIRVAELDEIINVEQTADSRQQKADSRQQRANSRQQTANNRRVDLLRKAFVLLFGRIFSFAQLTQ